MDLRVSPLRLYRLTEQIGRRHAVVAVATEYDSEPRHGARMQLSVDDKLKMARAHLIGLNMIAGCAATLPLS